MQPNKAKTKKGLIDWGEELEKAKERAKHKALDVSLIQNDVLRPWTIDLSHTGYMRIEAEKLDKTQTFTTPQKWAGIRGMSVLEAKPKGFDQIPLYVKKQVRMQEEDYEPTPPLSVKLPETSSGLNTAKSGSKQPSSKRSIGSEREPSGRSVSSPPLSPLSANVESTVASKAVLMKQKMAEDEDAEGIEYISRVQRSIYENSMRAIRRQEAPLHTIKYTPFKKKPATAGATSSSGPRGGIGFHSPAKLAALRKAAILNKR